jgi:hypothetical protein
MRITSISFFILISLFACVTLPAQDTEFKKGFIMHAKLHNGMITNFSSAPDFYVGGLQIVPQYTIVPNKVRVGLIGGAFYAGKKIELQGGPNVNLKLKTINASVFGGAANVNVALNHLWGSNRQKLLGGGFYLDLLNKLELGLTAHRDYNFNTWWWQTSLGIRISKTKKASEPFND